MSAEAAKTGEEQAEEQEVPTSTTTVENLHRLIRSRCALTVQAASKSNQNDGVLTVVLQLDTKPGAAASSTTTTKSSSSSNNNNIQHQSRLIEIELSPAQLFSMLAVLEEAHAKLASKQSEEISG